MYLTAVIDWFSRYVLSWKLSHSLDSSFCVDALEEALLMGKPVIFNTDQGVQFTSVHFIGILKKHQIQISMNSKGRALDNIFVERLWRTVKYEEIYLKEYQSVCELKRSLNAFFDYYNHQRHHQSLQYRKPFEVHYAR
jgi:putative transposase